MSPCPLALKPRAHSDPALDHQLERECGAEDVALQSGQKPSCDFDFANPYQEEASLPTRRSWDSARHADLEALFLPGSDKQDYEIFQAASGPLPLSLESNPRPLTAINTSVGKFEDADIRNWSSQEVAEWMFNVGFENSVISKFALHDISGAVLLDLKFEDLRDLDIASFGKRRQLWKEIMGLRYEGGYSLNDELFSDIERQCNPNKNSLKRTASERNRQKAGFHRRSISQGSGTHKTSCSMEPDPTPTGDTVDDIIPRPHRCSKGRKCTKYQQQKDIIDQVDKRHGPNTPPSETIQEFGELRPISLRPFSEDGKSTTEGAGPDRTRAASAPNPPESHHSTPARSDGAHEQPPATREMVTSQVDSPVSKASTSVETRRPKGPLQPPAKPSKNNTARLSHPPRGSSLHALPRLSIPAQSNIVPESPQLSGNRSARSPSPPFRNLNASTPNLLPSSSFSNPSHTGYRRRSPSTEKPSRKSPSPHHVLRSPASESDIPTTSPSPLLSPSTEHRAPAMGGVVASPALRSAASLDSVPKRRDFARLPTVRESKVISPITTRKPLPIAKSKPLPTLPRRSSSDTLGLEDDDLDNTFRQYGLSSGTAPATPAITPISPSDDKDISPSTMTTATTPSILYTPKTPTVPRTPRFTTTPSGSYPSSKPSPPINYGPSVILTGWVRRRRARLWRHEWQPAHLRLTGSQLTLHASARADDPAMETIEVEDFAVACSTVSGHSKISAAMRNVGSIGSLGGKIALEGGEAFSWQLVPATTLTENRPNSKGGRSGSISLTNGLIDEEVKEEVVAVNGERKRGRDMSKTYHFAVKTREERMAWMREVMIAKALKQRQKEQSKNPAAAAAASTVHLNSNGNANKLAEVEAKEMVLPMSQSGEATRARTSLDGMQAAPMVRSGSL